jgi:hypothetical protein
MTRYIENLYLWHCIDTDAEAADAYAYLDWELKLNALGIRTKVEKNQSHGYSLWVPLKDAEVAGDLVKGHVKEIVDLQKDPYIVFNSDMSYKNDALYSHRKRPSHYRSTKRQFVILALLILLLLIIVRFVKFS